MNNAIEFLKKRRSIYAIGKNIELSMPRWKPGKQNGSAVRVKYTVPVVFRLQ